MSLRLPNIISDNMVLQQGVKTRIWGWADPGETVNVSIAGRSAAAKADPAGKWLAVLSPLKPGGPFEMEIKAGPGGKAETLKIKNILIGEVWLASGQSNMEMRVRDLKKCGTFSKNVNYPRIRLFEVAQTASFEPLDDASGKWVECNENTVKDFSAAAYFFARDVFKGTGSPVGMIGSYWGGTKAEVWTDKQTLENLGGYEEDIAMAHPFSPEEKQRFSGEWEKAANQPDPGNKGLGLGYASPDFDDTSWQLMEMPSYWEDNGHDIDGAVWFRREIDIPEAMAGKELRLGLGAVDDFDTTYFNGVEVGATGRETPNWYEFQRDYKVPVELVKPGKNVIAVRVFDFYDKGGMTGPAENMALTAAGMGQVPGPGETISISGFWKYKIETVLDRPYLKLKNPDRPHDFATTLYNGMINPVVNFNIKGIIWYQGESNERKAKEYERLFKAMITLWRKSWQNPKMPFLFVQLANFRNRRSTAVEYCGWAQVRESQLKTLELPATGMAVIIDIGEANDIHPQNKLDVGKRLALIALGKFYSKGGEYYGPMYDSVKFKGGKAEVSFTHAKKGLKVKGDKKPFGFAIAGEKNKFVAAHAKIQGSKVLVWNNKIKNPTAVRYGWANNPPCNLYNMEGLPASPFRTDNW
ncbi:MAG: hypothetical protein A2297_09450 [Elusimicrobia bacterium RIFOXYB2_FULL_48_7]|nr:MAG: hypothetical protein A2297_09450 [Elusimicrobia bacterium RIFOXYB2_FULL_48_7]